MPRLSIVIPCVRDVSDFEDTLASVLQNRPVDCEILVVQPRPYEDPYNLSGEVRFLETAAHLSTVELINLGLQQAKSEIIHLLSCNTLVTDCWTEPAMAHFSDRSISSVTPRLVSGRGHDQVVTVGVGYALGGHRLEHHWWETAPGYGQTGVLGPALCAGFYRREAILEAGGFCTEAGESLADIDLAINLWARGHRTVHEAGSTVTMFHHGPPSPLSFRSGQASERMFWRHATLFDTSLVKMLAWHVQTVIVQLLRHSHRPSSLCHLAGRLSAVFTKSVGARRDLEDDAGLPCSEHSRHGISTTSYPRGSSTIGGGSPEAGRRPANWRAAA